MKRRGLSTALDVAVCLLLVSAAVGAIQLIPSQTSSSPPQPGSTLAALAAVGQPTAVGNHSTAIERLAAASVADAAGKADRVATLREIVGQLLDRLRGNHQVIATWTPISGLGLQGRVAIGASPPPTATVDASRLVVPLAGGDTGVAAANRSQLARIASRAIINRMAGGEKFSRHGVAEVSLEDRRGLLDQVRTALTERFDTVRTARKALSIHQVVIVVRTWVR